MARPGSTAPKRAAPRPFVLHVKLRDARQIGGAMHSDLTPDTCTLALVPGVGIEVNGALVPMGEIAEYSTDQSEHDGHPNRSA